MEHGHGVEPPNRTRRDAGSNAALQKLTEVLGRERPAAEATLGRPLVDPYAFAADCIADGLGHALNGEQDRIDELDTVEKRRAVTP